MSKYVVLVRSPRIPGEKVCLRDKGDRTNTPAVFKSRAGAEAYMAELSDIFTDAEYRVTKANVFP